MHRTNQKYHFIYVTTCSKTGKKYIGARSCDDLKDNYKGSGTLLKKDIKRFGGKHFTRNINSFGGTHGGYKSKVEESTKLLLSKKLKGRVFSNETCKKLSLAAIKRSQNPEYIKKLSKAGKGRVFSEEHRQRLSEARNGKKNHCFGRTGKKHPMFGKIHSEKAKRKMSIASKKYWSDKKQSNEC